MLKKINNSFIFFNDSSITISIMEQFHDFTMMLLTMIITFIFVIMMQIILTKSTNYNFKENINLEIIWTIMPMMILLLIAYPSLFYLYLFDINLNPMLSIKVIGAQWYWIYEFLSEKKGWSYPSYMISDYDLLNSNNYKMGWRLMETDSRLIIPSMVEVQCVTTSMDVIHSFTIPELGVKIDAIPGRLNSVNFMSMRPGIYFGQCSEICGTGHSFMPISVEAI